MKGKNVYDWVPYKLSPLEETTMVLVDLEHAVRQMDLEINVMGVYHAGLEIWRQKFGLNGDYLKRDWLIDLRERSMMDFGLCYVNEVVEAKNGYHMKNGDVSRYFSESGRRRE